MPTNTEECTAEANEEQLDESVARSYKKSMVLGANVKGEGEIDGVHEDQ